MGLARTHRGSGRAGARSGHAGTAPGPSSLAAGRRGSPAACGRTGCTWGGQTPPGINPQFAPRSTLGEGAAARAGTPTGDIYRVTFPRVGAGGGTCPPAFPCLRSAARAESVPQAGPPQLLCAARTSAGGRKSLWGCPSVRPSVQAGSSSQGGLKLQSFSRSSALDASPSPSCPPPTSPRRGHAQG